MAAGPANMGERGGGQYGLEHCSWRDEVIYRFWHDNETGHPVDYILRFLRS